MEVKRAIYGQFVPGLAPVMVEGAVDWRLVTWGGVLIDARAPGDTDKMCHCIPAVDAPEVTSAAGATWLKDEDIVFGLKINGEARAYPLRIMEVREMVNDTLGGRRVAIPYCTLCGAAQAYATDGLAPEFKVPVLRTSGLLLRSNKVMYDIQSGSVFDTFRGRAVTGPLWEAGVTLPRLTLITTDWGAWRKAHPNITVLDEALALGRDYNLRETRDAAGPIFPIGDVDPRLEMQDEVLGVISPSGTPVAFSPRQALLALQDAEEPTLEGVRLDLTAGGIAAKSLDGADLGSHEAFWFAWSQFYPETLVWRP